MASLFNRLSEIGHSAPLTLMPALYKHLISGKFDLIHILGDAGYVSTFQVVLYKMLSRKNINLCIRGAQNVCKKYPLPFRIFEQFSYRQVNSIICNGTEHREVVRRKGYRGRVDIIPLGVDDKYFIPKDATVIRRKLGLRHFTVGFVGKLSEQKRVNDLIHSFAKMPQDANLLILGSGPQSTELKKLSNQSLASSRIVFVEHVPHSEVVDYMNCMDLLVLPSGFVLKSAVERVVPIPWKEQFGRVIIEAMACKIPVVGSDSGEIPVVIGDAGLIFKSGDCHSLHSKLMQVYNDQSLAVKIAEAGYQRVKEKYSWAVVGEQIINLWFEIIKG